MSTVNSISKVIDIKTTDSNLKCCNLCIDLTKCAGYNYYKLNDSCSFYEAKLVLLDLTSSSLSTKNNLLGNNIICGVRQSKQIAL